MLNAIPILATKLTLPHLRPERITRSHLLERLNEGLRRGTKATLISAPAGFGKTTLIGDWLNTINDKANVSGVTWVSLDETDSDPASFMTYFLAGLKQIFPEQVSNLAQSHQTGTFPTPKTVITQLLNDISTADLKELHLLVLDDYHLIETQSIHNALALLLPHLPPTLHMIIISRSDPPLPLARLRARGQLTEIRQQDLRFTSTETEQFLNQLMGLNLSAEGAAALQTRTEGWVAGLQLAVLSLQDRTDSDDFIDRLSGSHRYILDYLMEEVWQRQPETIQRFLLETSFLEQLNGDLCNAVTCRQDSQAILEELERVNLFIVPLDDERHWYRYHGLLSDGLRRHFKDSLLSLPPEKELHRRAYRWYLNQDDQQQAIRHALAAKDFEQAAEILQTLGDKLSAQGKIITVRSWLNALPEQVYQHYPRLYVFRIWILLLFADAPNLEYWLAAAQQALDDDATRSVNDHTQMIADTETRLEVAALQTIASLFNGQFEPLHQLMAQVSNMPPPTSPFLQTLLALNACLPYELNGDVEAANQAYAQATQVSLKNGNPLLALVTMSLHTKALVKQGRLHEAAELGQRALQIANTPEGQPLLTVDMVYIILSRIYYEWNRLDLAEDYLHQAMKVPKIRYNYFDIEVQIDLAHIKQAQGDQMAAVTIMTQANTLVNDPGWSYEQYMLSMGQAWLALKRGETAPAIRWRRAFSVEKKKKPQLFTQYIDDREAIGFLEALLDIAQKQPNTALTQLNQMLTEAESLKRHGIIIKVLVCQALAYQALEDSVQAIDKLSQALKLAEPEEYIRTFLDVGEAIGPLLRDVIRADSQATYARHVLAAFQDKTPAANGSTTTAGSLVPTKPLPLLEPLTKRELEVLQLMAAGQSNPEIAETLVIAVTTVKKHINNIFSKFDVHSRTKALVRAKALDLI